MIYVTHDQTEALTFAQQVVVMHDGRVVQIGTPQELFERPAHRFVGYFIGSPGMNFLPAEIAGSSARLAGGTTLSLSGHYAPASGAIGIRPEHLFLTDRGGLPVTIRRIEDVGRHRLIRAKFQGAPLNIVAPEGLPIDGLPRVGFDARRINVYVGDWRVAPQEEAA